MQRTAMVLAALLVSCGERAPTGLFEPVRVHEAFFKSGDLPGAAPVPDGEPAGDGPRITAVENSNGVVSVHQGNKLLTGRASPDAYSVAVRFAELGTGYWVLPVGGPDPTANGELVWRLGMDLGHAIPPGLHDLRLVAIDGEGRAGTQQSIRLCVTPEYDDGLSACDPAQRPPGAVFTLQWDAPVDLDLLVETPDGKRVDAEHPTTLTGTIDRDALRGEQVGVLDRNSNAGCLLDGFNRESVVWRGTPAPGVYRVYARLASACGAPSVRFRFSALRRQAREGGSETLAETEPLDGMLTAVAANASPPLPLFLGEVSIP